MNRIQMFFRKLSLSTNMIEKISGLNGLKNLRVLSVGRNYIKSFNGLVSLHMKFFSFYVLLHICVIFLTFIQILIQLHGIG